MADPYDPLAASAGIAPLNRLGQPEPNNSDWSALSAIAPDRVSIALADIGRRVVDWYQSQQGAASHQNAPRSLPFRLSTNIEDRRPEFAPMPLPSYEALFPKYTFPIEALHAIISEKRIAPPPEQE